MFKEGRTFSFKKMVSSFWLIVYLVTVLIYVFTQIVITRQYTNNIEKNIKLSVSASEKAIENSLEMIDMYLYQSYYIRTPGSIFQLCNTYLNDEDYVDRHAALQALSHIVQGVQSWTDNVSFDMLYITSEDNGTWLEAGDKESFTVREALKQELSTDSVYLSDSSLGRYMVYESGDSKYLLRVMKFDRCYCIIGLSQKSILDILANARYNQNDICFASDENGDLIFASSKISDALIKPENDGEYVSIGDSSYLQVGYQSESTGYYFGILTSRSAIEGELLGTRILFMVILVITTILLFTSRLFVKRFVEDPITGGIKTMHEIEQGDFESSINVKTPITDFRILADSFNHMIDKIKALKIEKYESELDGQKATMQYLQLQIKPHFYANMMNIIYSLAQAGNFEMIQHVSRAIVNYSRYMFTDATDMVELRRELEFLDSYMDIQEIRYKKQIKLEKDIPDELIESLIPPFIIQTFVENSVKYAFSTKKSCLIKVKVKLSDDKESMILTIHDNGEGYPESLLDNSYKNMHIEGHVGLVNVYRRLQIIYDDKADLKLYNDNGALTIITIPYIDLGSYDYI
jgi:sensor histidine kinase YesM